ncbi:integrase [Burkholderia ambifaria]|nr:tyrosine-type recombinase/integrase [Burkholderia ambifaria]MDR6504239.1 integrase [Burkholderia ambifaria]
MSSLRKALCCYVDMRRGFGLKFDNQEKRLIDFVRFMEQRRATVVTNGLALRWVLQCAEHRPTSALRLAGIRGFARYLSISEPATEVLPAGILPWPRRSKPYLYTNAEIHKLMSAALDLRPADGLRRWTYYCLFGLLAVTGMRISEALALCRDDVDLKTGILVVHETKFGKSRLVPVHPTTRASLVRYVQQRDAHIFRARSPYFFVAEQGGKLLHQHVNQVFLKLSRQIGLRGPDDSSGPRIHDFRHSFAVRTLLTGYRKGCDADLLLPALSTYLGHAYVRDTYWYLSECPELMRYAANKLEERWSVPS